MKIGSDVRQLIIDELIDLGCVSGDEKISEFIRKSFPQSMDIPAIDTRFKMTNIIDNIKQHMERNDDWSCSELFFEYLNILCVSDEQFIYFLNQYVKPQVRRFTYTEDGEKEYYSNEQCVDIINKYLPVSGWHMEKTGELGNLPIYEATNTDPGVQGKIKNIIFASKYKPELVLQDALNNDVKIVTNEEHCLVYDQEIGYDGVTWEKLKKWYDDNLLTLSKGMGLTVFMRNSLSQDSPPERIFFDTYMSEFAEKNAKYPALFPQVWLYYDPKLQMERIKKIFEHQRMDFLLILSDSKRIVIEIDGVQHYSSVDKYAEMVSAQRDMTLAGYEVYRFGGKELHNEAQAKVKVKRFFRDLFAKHGIRFDK